jgi:hypothetical protein
MSTPGPVDALIAQLAAGALPEHVRLGAARGALPLPPADLLRIQSYLALSDPLEAVRAMATEALLACDAAQVAEIAAGDGISAEAAAFFAGTAGTDPRILEALCRNPACPDDPVARLAVAAESRIVEALLLNQVRLIRSPAVLEALESNPALTAGQRGRLAEIRKHFLAVPDDEPLPPEIEAEMEAAMRDAEEEEATRSSAAPSSAPVAETGEGVAPGEGGAGADEGLSTYQRILRMTPNDKVKLAYRGSAEERALLIRDSNRVVARSVLRSGRCSEKEVEGFANQRSLGEEVLRSIGANREWTKNYAVVLGLVRNPKTPPGMSLGFLQRLVNRDLNILGGDRNVTEVVRQTARRAFVARTAGRDGGK